MKNILFILAFLFSLEMFAQDVYIPNPNFLIELIEYDADINKDGKIQVWEAEARQSLTIMEGLTDFTGLEAFKNVTYLNISNNYATNLDLSNLTKLTNLNLSGNSLKSLDISKNTLLDTLQIKYLKIDTITLSQLPNLKYFDATLTVLKNLDVTQNTQLKDLRIGGTFISSIDLKNIPDLEIFFSNSTPISSIDFSKNTKLNTIILAKNILTELNVDNNVNLTFLDCSNNQLSKLSIINNTKLEQFNAKSNPNLSTICTFDTLLMANKQFEKDVTTNWDMACKKVDGLGFEIESTKVLFYPNPFENEFNIDASVVNLKVYNVFNQLILDSISIDNQELLDLLPGLYYVEFIDKIGAVFYRKVVKK